jgi:hypothetical protein
MKNPASSYAYRRRWIMVRSVKLSVARLPSVTSWDFAAGSEDDGNVRPYMLLELTIFPVQRLGFHHCHIRTGMRVISFEGDKRQEIE